MGSEKLIELLQQIVGKRDDTFILRQWHGGRLQPLQSTG
jgi:hypothetical protein